MKLIIKNDFFFLKSFLDDLCVLLFEDDEYEDSQDNEFEDDEDLDSGYYNGYDDDDYQSPDSDYEDE